MSRKSNRRNAAKLRALSAELQHRAKTEREIERLIEAVDHDLTVAALDAMATAAVEEAQRIAALQAAFRRGEITKDRFRRQAERVIKRTADFVTRVEAFVARVTEKLGKRLEAVLKTGPYAPP